MMLPKTGGEREAARNALAEHEGIHCEKPQQGQANLKGILNFIDNTTSYIYDISRYDNRFQKALESYLQLQ